MKQQGPRYTRIKATLASTVLSGVLMALMTPAVQAAVLQSKTYEYDAQGHVTKEIDANNQATVYTYDGNGNRLTMTDALNRITSYQYDALNRLTQVTDPNNGLTQYSYDARDNLVTVTDPRGLATTYTYNGLDQLLSQASPDTGTTTYTPNSAGQVTTRSNNASQTTQYQYDALGRVAQTSYADGRVVTHSYDEGSNGKGRLTTLLDSESRLSWTYDADGRVLTRTQTIGSGSGSGAQSTTISYQYNSAGQLTQMTTPGGATLTYTYDDQGRVQSLSRNGVIVLNAIQYRAFGGITGWTWGNGQIHTRTYDQNGRLDLLSVGSTVYDLNYDAVSRITAIQDMADNSQNRSFSYDTLDRLMGYTGQNSTRGWNYDAVGNRTSQIIGSTTENYVYASSSNRLQSLTNSSNAQQNRSYQYTTTGHTSSDGVNNYSYDARERLIAAATPTANATYTLNPLGQRIKKSVTQSGVTTTAQFVYDDAGRLITEADGTGVITSEYLWLGDIPVAWDEITTQSSIGTPVVIDPATSFMFNKWGTVTMANAYGGTARYAIANLGAPTGIVVDNDNANNVAPNGMTYSGVNTWVLRSNYRESYGSGYLIRGAQLGTPQGTIIDNTQATVTGVWQTTNCSVDCQGSNFREVYAGTGSPLATITWTMDIAIAGTYSVYVMRPVTRTDSLTYTVQYGSTVQNVALGGYIKQGVWTLLGTYTVPAGPLSVSFDNHTNVKTGNIQADAILVADPGAPRGYFNAVNWTANLPTAGTYEVYTALRHQEGFPHPVAQYTVNHAAGSTQVSINQPGSSAGPNAGWQLLGTYSFNAGLNTVSVSDQGTDVSKVILADAILFTLPGAPLGNFNDAIWTPALPTAGLYDVQAWWPTPHTSYGSSTVWYTVHTSQGPIKVVKDQTQQSGQWVSLGQFSLDPATAKVTLADYGVAGKRVYADAVRFIPVSNTVTHTVYYVHPDHLNTPRQLTTSDAANTVVWRWDSEPFGSSLADSDPDQNSQALTFNLRFPGQYYDAETGLNYNYFRDYSPSTGRYIESDPIGLRGGINTYAYGGASPVGFIDYLGLALSGPGTSRGGPGGTYGDALGNGKAGLSPIGPLQAVGELVAEEAVMAGLGQIPLIGPLVEAGVVVLESPIGAGALLMLHSDELGGCTVYGCADTVSSELQLPLPPELQMCPIR